jgi:hypothetical protein
MNRQQLSLQERMERAEQIRKQKAAQDAVKIETYRRSFGKKADQWVRIIFFIQVLVSLLGFFYFPFHENVKILDYPGFKGRIPMTDLLLENKSTIRLMSFRLKYLDIKKGDEATIDRNLFYKKEALTLSSTNTTCFFQSKGVWMFLQLILTLGAVVTMSFKKASDLRIIRRVTVFLIIGIVLYFFV